MLPKLCVRNAQTQGGSSIGETLRFDFSSDVAEGGSILSYGVGLAGFLMNYETNSPFWAEKMGMLAVRIVPNLVGTTLYAAASAIMTDYDGDAGRDTGGQGDNPNCFVQATAVALIGDSNPNDEVVLGNVYGVGNGQVVPGIRIGSNPFYGGFLTGFSAATSGSPGSIKSLSYGVSDSVDQGLLSVTSSVAVGSLSAVGSVDALVVSAPTTVTNFQVVPLQISLGKSNGQKGMSGPFTATFTVPTGMSIVNYGLLQQKVDIVYEDNAQFELIAAYFSNLASTGNAVTGTYTLNMFNPDFLADEYISNDSTITVYALAQFGTAGGPA